VGPCLLQAKVSQAVTSHQAEEHTPGAWIDGSRALCRRGRKPSAAAAETPAAQRYSLRNGPAASMPPPVTPRAAASGFRSARTNRTAPVNAGASGTRI
jgi:hypothetical protein